MKPYRKYELAIRVSADNKDALIRRLEHFVHMLETEYEDTANLTSGGLESGGWMRLFHKPDQTNEGYLDELREWLDGRRDDGITNPYDCEGCGVGVDADDPTQATWSGPDGSDVVCLECEPDWRRRSQSDRDYE